MKYVACVVFLRKSVQYPANCGYLPPGLDEERPSACHPTKYYNALIFLCSHRPACNTLGFYCSIHYLWWNNCFPECSGHQFTKWATHNSIPIWRFILRWAKKKVKCKKKLKRKWNGHNSGQRRKFRNTRKVVLNLVHLFKWSTYAQKILENMYILHKLEVISSLHACSVQSQVLWLCRMYSCWGKKEGYICTSHFYNTKLKNVARFLSWKTSCFGYCLLIPFSSEEVTKLSRSRSWKNTL